MMLSARGATQTASLWLMACAFAACSVDHSGLATVTGSPAPGHSDASPDLPALDVGSEGAPDVPLNSVDADSDGASSDGAEGGDSPDGGDAGAAEIPAMLDATADGTDAADAVDAADAFEVEVNPPPAVVGCADGAREGLLDLATYPAIAACEGGWQVQGLISNAARSPACARAGGNQGTQPDGQGCSAADLCAAGWHVCESAAEVTSRGGKCADAILPANGRKVFYATRQPGDDSCNSSGNSGAGPNGDNLVHGCGNFALVSAFRCAPLNASMHDDDCTANPPWRCNTSNNRTEISVVTKPGSALGGVLCCKD
jgi:hypothetical protein